MGRGRCRLQSLNRPYVFETTLKLGEKGTQETIKQIKIESFNLTSSIFDLIA